MPYRLSAQSPVPDTTKLYWISDSRRWLLRQAHHVRMRWGLAFSVVLFSGIPAYEIAASAAHSGAGKRALGSSAWAYLRHSNGGTCQPVPPIPFLVPGSRLVRGSGMRF